VDLGGTVTGYGVLLINGDLSIAHGTPRWEGLIFATGVHADRSGDGSEFKGTVDIYGALILSTTRYDLGIPRVGESSTLDFSINGDVNLMYSSAALAPVAQLIPMMKTQRITVVLGDIREIASQRTVNNSFSNYTTAGGGG